MSIWAKTEYNSVIIQLNDLYRRPRALFVKPPRQVPLFLIDPTRRSPRRWQHLWLDPPHTITPHQNSRTVQPPRHFQLPHILQEPVHPQTPGPRIAAAQRTAPPIHHARFVAMLRWAFPCHEPRPEVETLAMQTARAPHGNVKDLRDPAVRETHRHVRRLYCDVVVLQPAR